MYRFHDENGMEEMWIGCDRKTQKEPLKPLSAAFVDQRIDPVTKSFGGMARKHCLCDDDVCQTLSVGVWFSILATGSQRTIVW